MDLIKSKKFRVLISGIATVILTTLFGLSDEVAGKIVVMVLGYLGSQGLADFGKERPIVQRAR